MTKSILIYRSAIALGSILVMTAPATAGSGEPTATVSTADVSLGSPTGVEKLRDRISAAAADLCLTTAVEPLDVRLARTKCYRTAIANGDRQLSRMETAQAARLRKSAATTRVDPSEGGQP